MNEDQWNTIESYNKTAKDFSETIGKLHNYDHTYDFLITGLRKGDRILDLACGPAHISRYIIDRIKVSVTGVDLSDKMLEIARTEIPSGNFYRQSIIDFSGNEKYHAVIIGFGIPYLNKQQTEECIKNAINNTIDRKYLYISFMHGNGSKIEKTSFGGNHDFKIYYHNKNDIKKFLQNNNMEIVREYELDYPESDGSISKDIIYISQRLPQLKEETKKS